MKPPPEGDYTLLLQHAEAAIRAVLGDPAAWAEEVAREDAPREPWPLVCRPEDGYPELLRQLARVAVENTREALHARAGMQVPEDPTDEGFQLVLRIARRAVDAADKAVRREFGGKRGGGTRIDGSRAFYNWLKARAVDLAIASGGKRKEALQAFPLSRRSAYRAMNRKAKR